MKQPTPWWMWLLPLPVVWWAALLTAGAWQPGMDLLQLMAGLSTVLQRPWDIRWTQYSGRCLLLFTLAYAVGIGMALSNTTATRRGEEHGSARWGDVFSIARRYRDKRGGNLILTQHFSIGWDGYRHKHNINVLVVGGSGAGKTRGYCVPNILEAAGRDQNESPLDMLFSRLEMRDPESIALKQYRVYKMAAGKTAKSILVSVGVRLSAFLLPEVAKMTCTDELHLEELGEKKVALFCCIPDSEKSLNYLVGLMYGQLIQTLYYEADRKHKGRLPVPVHLLIDEAPNISLPTDSFLTSLATMRSRGIFTSYICQNMAQIKALFNKQWESLVGLCDEFLYLGGTEKETHKYVSELIGKQTISSDIQNRSRGRNGSCSTSTQLSGRELLMPDEIRLLDNGKAILFVRGERPMMDSKYDLKHHPNVRYTEDGGAPPYDYTAARLVENDLSGSPENYELLDILILDPESEFGQLVKALGGEVLPISPHSSIHLNALDIDRAYGEGKNPLVDKVKLVLSVFEPLTENGLTAKQRSILDRCARLVYREYIRGGYRGAPPTLVDLRRVLLEQPEAEAHDLALASELYTTGSLNIFAHQTNVNTDACILCYDIRELDEQLRPVGMVVTLDAIFNRVIRNWRQGKRTWILADEFYILFRYSFSAEFFYRLFKRMRKYNAFITAISQNVDEILRSDTARLMLANSELLVMLNQAATDREELAKLLNISENQLSYITNVPAGHGIIRCGGAIIPFENSFPKNTKLYRLMTTKPNEKFL